LERLRKLRLSLMNKPVRSENYDLWIILVVDRQLVIRGFS